MDPKEMMRKLLEQRAEVADKIDDVMAKAVKESRGLNDDETTDLAALEAEDKELAERYAQIERQEARREARIANAIPVDGVHVGDEPLTYERGNGQSFFADLARSNPAISGDSAAAGRIQRHKEEMDVEIPKRNELRKRVAETELRNLNPDARFERRVNPSRIAGQGGELVPPLWLEDQWIAFLRAGRPFADRVRQVPLPEGTDSINLPKIATGTATGVQTADNAAVTSVDLTTGSVSAPVRTIAGQQDVSLQLIEQSPVAFDEIVFADLMADYNQRVDVQCLQGTGASGQLQGVDTLGSTTGVTYTSGSPTPALMYTAISQGISKILAARFMPPEFLFMHPRRWYSLTASTDTSGRPLVVPQGPAYNALANQSANVAQGEVGNLLGVPVVLDPNIITNDGSGTNQDRIYPVKTSDLILYEGSLRSRALAEVLSGTLQVRLQVYNYVAFLPNRYPQSVGVISGTGLTAPTGY